MSIIKSFSVGNGDMFYIQHESDNFSIIDCNLIDEFKNDILDEINIENNKKTITRFISTHPDDDHIHGLKALNDKITIVNFYCVENKISSDDSEDFNEYCKLRDGEHHFYIEKDCSRKWMNKYDEERGSSGIFILWPDVNRNYFKDELEKIENNDSSPNNLSPIIQYSLEEGITALWFGDLEDDFLEKIEDNNDVDFPQADIIFAPHHGRKSGKIPKTILDKINPKIIVIGEAESEHLDYYEGYNTITQNTAKNIVLECVTNQVHVYTSKSINADYLDKLGKKEKLETGEEYQGTLILNND